MCIIKRTYLALTLISTHPVCSKNRIIAVKTATTKKKKKKRSRNTYLSLDHSNNKFLLGPIWKISQAWHNRILILLSESTSPVHYSPTPSKATLWPVLFPLLSIYIYEVAANMYCFGGLPVFRVDILLVQIWRSSVDLRLK